jgi:hypothetical protein
MQQLFPPYQNMQLISPKLNPSPKVNDIFTNSNLFCASAQVTMEYVNLISYCLRKNRN